ncbi:hypothetical protein [Psychromonas sp. SP041]|uniref:hypothetical protein n=1 Tax=Psychromonas sp. SP041 TaxID=1365007 RepID=UPI0003FFD246|nr:hypothetical protein [Psychromonas sp. SP041]
MSEHIDFSDNGDEFRFSDDESNFDKKKYVEKDNAHKNNDGTTTSEVSSSTEHSSYIIQLTDKEREALQMDLFSLVDEAQEENSIQRYSNAIGDIDMVPRYIRGKNPPLLASDVKVDQEIICKNEYKVNGNDLVCEIHPATIMRKEGEKTVSYLMYPGDREEVIERVLFMIASNNGLEKKAIPGSSPRYGVYFSLYQIREELKKIGKTKPYDVIRESLIVLRDSKNRISQSKNGKSITITNDVIADAALETTGTGRAKDRCFISFSDYVVEQIFKLNYQQYSFDSVLSHKGALARFLHSYLCWNWRNSYEGATYKIETEKIMASFGKSQLTMAQKRRDIREALGLLVKSGHIPSVPYANKNCYTITAKKKLASEIKLSMQKQLGLKRISAQIEEGKRDTLPAARRFNGSLVNNNNG